VGVCLELAEAYSREEEKKKNKIIAIHEKDFRTVA
jgi:hypothetical protein